MNLFAISGLTCGIATAILALVALLLGKTTIHRILALFNISVSIWGFGCFMAGIATTESAAIHGWRFGQTGGIFIAVFFYHIISIFCGLQRRFLLASIYIWGLSFLYFCFNTNLLFDKTRFIYDVYYNDATWLYASLVASWLFIVSLSFFEILRFFPKTKGVKRTQTLYLIIGFLTGFLGGASTLIPMFRVNLPPFGNFTIPVYCFISTYAILRYHLLDINIVIKKTMVYSLSTGILTSLFVVFILGLTKLLSDYAGVSSFAIYILSAFIITFLFNPLKNRIQTIIDKIFYKTTYDYYTVIQNVSHKLALAINKSDIYSFVADTVFSTLKTKNACFLTAENNFFEANYFIDSEKKPPAKDSFRDGILMPPYKIPKDSELIKLFEKKNEIIIREELPNIIREDESKVISEILSPLNAEVAVPIFIDNKLAHLLLIGEKLSGDIFSDEDVKLLDTIATQATIAIKKAALYDEKIQSERLASIGMMSATLAHEIKNPLASIKIFTQLVPDKHNELEFRETFVRIVSSEIERIDGLVTELLDFSKQVPIKTSKVSGQKLCDNIIELIEKNFEKNNIKILKKYNGSFNIAGDPARLKQAFLNIFINSQQAMDSGGTLEVELSSQNNFVNISISDNGKGIPESVIDKIFDPFFTTKERGAGLGLALSKKIIVEHGGTIEVKSTDSNGTMFLIALPFFKQTEGEVSYGTDSNIKQ